MISLISDNLEQISALCRQFRMRKLELFGSAVTGAFNPATSDVDLIIEESIRNPYFRYSANQSRETIYEAGDSQAVA